MKRVTHSQLADQNTEVSRKEVTWLDLQSWENTHLHSHCSRCVQEGKGYSEQEGAGEDPMGLSRDLE